MVKLKSLSKGTTGQAIILPLVGQVEFDTDNCIEIDEELVDDLLGLQFGIELVKEEDEEAKEEEVHVDETETVEDATDAINTGIDPLDEIEVTEEAIKEEVESKQMTEEEIFEYQQSTLQEYSVKDLRSLLEDFPKEETKKLKNKSAIVNYLAKKNLS